MPHSHTITERALFQRIRRRLAREGERLLACAERSRGHANLGRYYTVDRRNVVHRSHLDLRALGAELGVLASNEDVEKAP